MSNRYRRVDITRTDNDRSEEVGYISPDNWTSMLYDPFITTLRLLNVALRFHQSSRTRRIVYTLVYAKALYVSDGKLMGQ